jgi:hypothetical protein
MILNIVSVTEPSAVPLSATTFFNAPSGFGTGQDATARVDLMP